MHKTALLCIGLVMWFALGCSGNGGSAPQSFDNTNPPLGIIGTSCANFQPSLKADQRILWVGAHGDDFGPVLGMLTKLCYDQPGAQCRLMTLAAYYLTDHSGNFCPGETYPAGTPYSNINSPCLRDLFDSEVSCAATKLNNATLTNKRWTNGTHLNGTPSDPGYDQAALDVIEEWGGLDQPNSAYGDVLKEIREFKPHLIIAFTSDIGLDGHSDHRATSIIVQKAFDDAANPDLFPELGPAWQADEVWAYLNFECAAITQALRPVPFDKTPPAWTLNLDDVGTYIPTPEKTIWSQKNQVMDCFGSLGGRNKIEDFRHAEWYTVIKNKQNQLPDTSRVPLPQAVCTTQTQPELLNIDENNYYTHIARFKFPLDPGYPQSADAPIASATVYWPADVNGNTKTTISNRFGIAAVRDYNHPNSTQEELEYGAKTAVLVGLPSVTLVAPYVPGKMEGLTPYPNEYEPPGNFIDSTINFNRNLWREYERGYGVSGQAINESPTWHRNFEYHLAKAYLDTAEAARCLMNSIYPLPKGQELSEYLAQGNSKYGHATFNAAKNDPTAVAAIVGSAPIDLLDYADVAKRRWWEAGNVDNIADDYAFEPNGFQNVTDFFEFFASTGPTANCAIDLVPGVTVCGFGKEWRDNLNFVELKTSGKLTGKKIYWQRTTHDLYPIDLERRAMEKNTQITFDGLSFVPNQIHTEFDPYYFDNYRTFLANAFGTRPLPTITESYSEDGVNVVVTANVTSSSTIESVTLFWRNSSGQGNVFFGEVEGEVIASGSRYQAVTMLRTGTPGQYQASFPIDFTKNQVYFVDVQDTDGGLVGHHSSAPQVIWRLGDPAAP